MSLCGRSRLLFLLFLASLGGGATAQARTRPALSGELLAKLSGHGRWWGLSVVGADGVHPLRRPRELWLAFGVVTKYGGEEFEEKTDEHAALFWEVNCNEYDYRIDATPSKFMLSFEGSTAVLCLGPEGREDDWLERFFSANPHWKLADGRLMLTAEGARIVLGHRHSGVERREKLTGRPATTADQEPSAENLILWVSFEPNRSGRPSSP